MNTDSHSAPASGAGSSRSRKALQAASVLCWPAGAFYVLSGRIDGLLIAVLYFVGAYGLHKMQRYGGIAAATAASLTLLINLFGSFVVFGATNTGVTTGNLSLKLLRYGVWLVASGIILAFVVWGWSHLQRPRSSGGHRGAM